MPKRNIEGQTVGHRSPECVFRGKKINQAIDMWSVGVVANYMCGNPFCEVKEEELPRLIRMWVGQLGAPLPGEFTGPAWEQHAELFRTSPKEPSAWPPGMATALGTSGQHMVSSCFSYRPERRLSPGEALEHPFLAVDCFPLMGLCREDAESVRGVEGEGLGREPS